MFLPCFDSPTRHYTFYYDESNNHRKFYINENDGSYNVDNDPRRKHAAATNFMLAGLAHRGDTCTANTSDLIKCLRLQKTAKELKFDQVASGNFDAVLKSAKINQILKWILDSDLYIHYFNLSMEYWAFVDIIDDCVHHCLNSGRIRLQSEQHWRHFLDFHKDVLFRLLEVDKANFLETMRKFNYPKIHGNERDFLLALRNLAINRANLLSLNDADDSIAEEIKSMTSLADLLSECMDIEGMDLTFNDEAGLLVDGLSVFYQNRGVMFKNSMHVFDDEFSVEDDLKILNSDTSRARIKYRFVNSVDSHLTQISDVVAGLFAKYFEFIERNTMKQILNMKSKFNRYQQETLRLMREIIDKSDNECKPFLYYVMTASAHHKHGTFMFPDEYRG
ncbi:hypothetical protein [Burkholderia cepacia]|uniref:hypothetical protein n=1 Tax=Burkholderia cepacia TaxID=292 RepID=UPI000AE19E9D|nr:hypothetical protein [Burkholderia cepacia]